MRRALFLAFPFLGWFKGANRATLRADLIAGLTVALVLIPQSMAYAELAGLPAYYGLYAAFLPPMIAALFGSSRQLSTGPVAVVSLMTSASLAPLAVRGSDAYIAYAIILAFTVGLFQLALGVLRLGLVVNFLSHPVVNGFTNGAAIIIASSQVSKLVGVSVDDAERQYQTVIRVVQAALVYVHWPTVGMGVLAFAMMYALKKLNPRIPYVLVAVVVTTLIASFAGFRHDAKTNLASIMSSEVQALIRDYNQSIEETTDLGSQRAGLTAKLADARRRSPDDHAALLDLEHSLALLNAQIDDLTEEAGQDRERLRLTLFDAVKGPDGTLRYYPPGQVHAPISGASQLWRLRVGAGSLSEDALVMCGGGAVIGAIPQGLPALSPPNLVPGDVLMLLPYAAIISLIGFVEAISIAKAMAAKSGQFLDPNQELIGQGLANIVGSFGRSYPTSGSFSRSAVNFQTGAFSGLSSVVTSLTVVVTLMFLTPLLYNLPQATLAAVIMMAVIGLISPLSFVHAFRTYKVDGAICLITFLATLYFAPDLDKGVMLGVALSLGVFIYKSMKPRVAHLSLHPDQSYRDAEHWGLAECAHIAMLRYDGNLFFANASYFEKLVMDRVNNMPKLKQIVLVANGINDMDASGEDVLSLIVDNVRSAGIGFSMSGVKERVLEMMKRTRLYEKIGENHIYPTQVAAVKSIFDRAHRGTSEDDCPLMVVAFREPQNAAGHRGRPKLAFALSARGSRRPERQR